jgi:hypothetical protein
VVEYSAPPRILLKDVLFLKKEADHQQEVSSSQVLGVSISATESELARGDTLPRRSTSND